jgi:hypothetical protein
MRFANSFQGVVVQPVDVADIQAALLWAQAHSVDLAVKGGGHSTAGTSSSEGGLVIDLSRMTHVSVDVSSKTITAHGGLTLGGGYGWLSGQYGLTIDNLRSARVVLADGSLVTASATEHPDLFWGLRGAGYNFGVVVEFTYLAYDQSPLVYSGILGFSPDKLEKVIEQLNGTLANPDSRSGAMCIFAQAPDGSGPMIIVICFYNGTREEGQDRFAGFLALEPLLNTVDMIPYSVVNTLQNPQATYGDRKAFKGIFYEPPLDPHFMRSVFEEFMAKLQSNTDLMPSAIILEFIDMRKICERSLSTTAFASRNMTQNGILYMRWTDSSKDLEYRTWARGVQAKWKAELEARKKDLQGGNDVPQYINYAERKFFCFAGEWSYCGQY